MPIRTNRFYNDPAIGAAFDNIASMFAPPSGADAAGYATAAAKKAEAERLSEMFNYAHSSDYDQNTADRMGVLGGLYAPTQSYYSVDQGNATARRGQDVSAQTSIANDTADNQQKTVSSMFQPLNQGQVRPAVPGGIAGMFGLPELPAEHGLAPNLSEDQLKAQILAAMSQSDQQAAALSGIPVEQTVGPAGAPQFTRRSDAVGQEAYVNKGAAAKPTNGMAVVNGVQVAVIQGGDGRWLEAQTGTPIPQGVPVYDMPKPQGTNEELGLGKPGQNEIDKQLIDIAVTKNTAVQLRNAIAKSPASQGAVGWLRGTAQNVIQTGGELGNYFGGGLADVNSQIKQGLADADLLGSFDPNIPAIEMMGNLLAFQYAKTTTGGDRLSNQMVQQAKHALGLDAMTANQADSIARLNTAVDLIGQQETILRGMKQDGFGPQTNPAPAAVPDVTGKTATNPTTGQRVQWNGTAWVPLQ